MARWLGIGRDDLKADEFTYEHESLSSQSQNSQIITDKELASLFKQSSEITGISDLGHADNPLPNFWDNQQSEFNEWEKELPTGWNNKKIKKTKTKKTKTSVTSQEIPDVSPLEESIIQPDEWKPDLTGWEVSIGLPK